MAQYRLAFAQKSRFCDRMVGELTWCGTLTIALDAACR